MTIAAARKHTIKPHSLLCVCVCVQSILGGARKRVNKRQHGCVWYISVHNYTNIYTHTHHVHSISLYISALRVAFSSGLSDAAQKSCTQRVIQHYSSILWGAVAWWWQRLPRCCCCCLFRVRDISPFLSHARSAPTKRKVSGCALLINTHSRTCSTRLYTLCTISGFH